MKDEIVRARKFIFDNAISLQKPHHKEGRYISLSKALQALDLLSGQIAEDLADCKTVEECIKTVKEI